MVDWDDFDKFEPVIDEYMPPRGEGETKASQIVTAVNKLVYKWYNDGDVYDNTATMKGWCNDLSSYANWLEIYVEGARQILRDIFISKNDDDYEELLYRLASKFLDKELLKKYEIEKEGTIYNCNGPYMFVYEDDQEDWYCD